MIKHILNTSDLAERFEVSRITIYRWAKDGLIPAFKVANQPMKGGGKAYSWRFRVFDIDSWEMEKIEKQEQRQGKEILSPWFPRAKKGQIFFY